MVFDDLTTRWTQDDYEMKTINYNFILTPFQRFNVSTLEKLESIFPSENEKTY